MRRLATGAVVVVAAAALLSVLAGNWLLAQSPAGSIAGGGIGGGALIAAGVQSVTCADSGGVGAGALTLTPTMPRVHITNADADGCAVTMGETDMVSGMSVQIIVVSNAGTTVDFADTAGVSEIAGAFTAAVYDSITLGYVSDRWVELARSNN